MLTRRTTFDERFKFSEAQWCAIDREIGKACIYHYPDMRELLEYVADDYCRNRCNHQPASKNARQWRRRAKLAAQLLAEIVGPGDEQQHWLLELTAHFSLAAGKKKVGAIKSLQHSAEVEDLVESFLAALKSLQDSAEVVAGEIEGHEFGYEHPRMLFFNQIAVWWFNMGGPFAASRNIKTGAPDGPFVRFLQAVIGPVMGTDAPTPEGIYKIIHREKKQLIQFGFAFDKDGRAVVDDQGIAVRS